ncbi:FAD linked oxidase domain protein [Desulfitobacterium hafniense DCB-2]|uniref:D-lactate dehydrogenase (cytochrome) n=2 Tax=Desulfitobacterium hafniense TaxID=49338 RepID=Q8RPG8_DESHA|nr:FAD-binding oxidoreductase [Desulfitobacterium hafniense]AAL87784.1 unknown [Desulfitobacterium hafniense DCB-2]ACL18771.1 FAD linked oxidase domain protein [Desulfitobacterium hafniense DCB-2]
MSNAIISRLKGIVGDQYVINNPGQMAQYLKGNGKPAAVVCPGNTAEVAGIVKLANSHNIKISAAGQVADTKALDGGIALIMNRMNRILEIDHENMVAVVEPGMSHQEFLKHIGEAGFNFPPEPCAVDTSSLGGCFAIGDSDSKSFNYGPTRTYLLGFEMVLPTGEVLNIGNKCIKNVSGLDFIHLAVASQGTLGIFTKLLVRLLAAPLAKKAVIARFASIHKANAALNTLIKRHIHPDRMNLISESLTKEVLPGAGHLALIDLEGFVESGTNLAKEIAAMLTLGGGTDVQIIDDAGGYENVINAWLKVRQTLYNQPGQVLEFAVGPMKMPQALTQLEGIIGDLGAYPGVVIEGLLGFARLLLPENADKMALAAQVNKMALSLGGNITGFLGQKLICQAQNDAEMWADTTALLNELRNQFDPKGILSPGVSLQA